MVRALFESQKALDAEHAARVEEGTRLGGELGRLQARLRSHDAEASAQLTSLGLEVRVLREEARPRPMCMPRA